MKKYVAVILVFALLLPVLAGCQSALAAQHTQNVKPASQVTVISKETPVTSTPAPLTITREKALEIALADAGLTQQEIYDLEVELDREKGIWHYDVDFEKDGKDYDYEIHAETGEILKKEVPTAAPVTPTPTPPAPTTPAPTTPPATEAPKRLTKAEAKAIALAHAGLTEDRVWDLDVELDREKGVLIFEVDFEAGGYEYEYDIHAETGEILHSEKERD